MCPAASEQIQVLKKAKRRKAEENADELYKTIIHADLNNALLTGVAHSVSPLTDEPGWLVIVHGMDREGEKLCVECNLLKDEAEPLLVMNFVPLQDE
jgi:hypothetical protein